VEAFGELVLPATSWQQPAQPSSVHLVVSQVASTQSLCWKPCFGVQEIGAVQTQTPVSHFWVASQAAQAWPSVPQIEPDWFA